MQDSSSPISAIEYSDRTLTCVDCGQQFIFSAGEQMFFKERQFEHERKRCNKCRAKRASVRARVEARAVCRACGTPTIVPFIPRQKRPVLCRSCFVAATAQWIADCGAA